jgi:hypothetical protein
MSKSSSHGSSDKTTIVVVSSICLEKKKLLSTFVKNLFILDHATMMSMRIEVSNNFFFTFSSIFKLRSNKLKIQLKKEENFTHRLGVV